MRDLRGRDYPEPYRTNTAQKRRREAADKVKHRRTSRRQAKQEVQRVCANQDGDAG